MCLREPSGIIYTWQKQKRYRDDSIILLFAQRRNIGVKLIVVIETGIILELWTSDFIFGSRANGLYSTNSDIDLALNDEKTLNRYDVGEAKAMFAESNIAYQIDIVDLNNISDRLKNIILQEGKEWKI